jgi:hypothetical protein
MDNKIVCYCQSKTGYVIDEEYCSVYHCAAMIAEEFKIDFDDAYIGVITAISEGTVYPEGSGFTFDYILQPEDIGQQELF